MPGPADEMPDSQSLLDAPALDAETETETETETTGPAQQAGPDATTSKYMVSSPTYKGGPDTSTLSGTKKPRNKKALFGALIIGALLLKKLAGLVFDIAFLADDFVLDWLGWDIPFIN